jgi:outer membrane protein OmpA-like peptidoglycan-associated protein
MKRAMVVLILCCATAVTASACATKKFVRAQVGATEDRLGQRVDTQETEIRTQQTELRTQQTELRQTAERTGANAQALEAANQRLQGVDSRVTEVSALAKNAQEEAGAVAQRFANRNKYAALETKSVYFDFDKAELRDEGFNELEEIARALKADPNAVVELQGFADSRGSDVYNQRLTRERVDAVVRYLVQRHGVELRRVFGVGMGKVPQAAGEGSGRDALAKSRRVDIVLLAPQR